MTTQPSAESEQQHPSKFRFWLDARLSPDAQQQVITWARRLLLTAVFGLLLYQLSGVGWTNLWRDIPTQPLFYVIFVGMYLGLPVAETFAYQLIWGLPFREVFPMMIKKRVFNKDVVNYSGEANLFLWAKTRLDRRGRLILRDIKDNTVISSLTSMFIAFGLLSTFLFTGLLPLEQLVNRLETTWMIGGGFCLILLIALMIRFRKSVIALPWSLSIRLFGIHVSRIVLVQALQIIQWVVVMPEVPFSAWITLLSAQIVTNQIPLIPAKGLLLVSASAELAGWLKISESGIIGMLLVAAVLDRVVNFILFSYLSSKKGIARDA